MGYRTFLLLLLTAVCSATDEPKLRTISLDSLQGVWQLQEQKPSQVDVMLAIQEAQGATEEQLAEARRVLTEKPLPSRTVTMEFRGNIMTVSGMAATHSGSQASSSRFVLQDDRVFFDAPSQPGARIRLGRTTLLYVADAIPAMGMPEVRYLYKRIKEGQNSASLQDREAFLAGSLSALAFKAFPGHPGIVWQVEDMRHRGPLTDILVAPQPDRVGYTRLRFMVSFGEAWPTEIDAIYGFQNGKFMLIATGASVKEGVYPVVMSAQ